MLHYNIIVCYIYWCWSLPSLLLLRLIVVCVKGAVVIRGSGGNKNGSDGHKVWIVKLSSWIRNGYQTNWPYIAIFNRITPEKELYGLQSYNSYNA